MPIRISRALGVLGLTTLLFLGCTNSTKYQYGIRGVWRLESREEPDGTIIEPPAVSGVFEWYPTGETTAQITAAVTQRRDRIQLSNYSISFDGDQFVREEFLRIGGGYGKVYQAGQETPKETVRGKITTVDDRRKLEYDDDSVQEHNDVVVTVLEDAVMKITLPDGTVDTWRRSADQLGVLAK